MDWINIIGLMISLALSSGSLFLVFTWRKKDFQLAILKDQMNAYSDLLENLFETSQGINDAYNDKISKLILAKGIDYSEEDITTNQSLVFIEFSKQYNASFNRFQKRIFLLPEDVIDATMEYYNYMSDLFEHQNNSELGLNLLVDLNQKIYGVINVIRNHAVIDDITDKTKRMLSEGQQLKFT